MKNNSIIRYMVSGGMLALAGEYHVADDSLPI